MCENGKNLHIFIAIIIAEAYFYVNSIHNYFVRGMNMLKALKRALILVLILIIGMALVLGGCAPAPADTEKPDDPGASDNPGEPETPNEPETPSEPSEPVEPSEPLNLTVEKTVSHSEGRTAYKGIRYEYLDYDYRGDYIIYTYYITNNGEDKATVDVTDKVPLGTALVSGGETVSGRDISWQIEIAAGETVEISFKVEVGKDVTDRTKIVSDEGTVDGKPVACTPVYVARTFNEIDIEYMKLAINVMQGSRFVGVSFAEMAYTVAFTQGPAISKKLSGDAASMLALIESGDAALTELVAPGLYGGSELASPSGTLGTAGGEVTLGDLVAGDIILLLKGGKSEMYIVGNGIMNITERSYLAETASVLESIGTAEKYAVLRPSFAMTSFTASDPDESAVEMNDYQKALVATAEAYLLRGEMAQYEDTYFGNTSKSGELRAEHGIKAPEDYTSDNWGYINCAVFTYDVYMNALGYTLPSDMYTTARLEANSESYGMRINIDGYTGYGEYTDAEKLAIEKAFLKTLEVGDIMVIRRTSGSGHAMLYVGNGKFIHSGGSVFSFANGVGTEVYEATVRCHRIHDYFFTEGVGGYLFYENENEAADYNTTPISAMFIVRPLNVFNGEIPENTKNRINNLGGVRVEKLSTVPGAASVNNGDEITYTFRIFNTNSESVTLDILDRVPANATLVSANGTVSGDDISWTVTVGPGETVTVSYTVKVSGESGYKVSPYTAAVGGVAVNYPATFIKNTLTGSEKAAILSAIDEIKSEGTALTGLALVNEIYRRALGWENIFTTTDADEVAAGDEGVFVETSTKVSGKYLHKLNTEDTYYRSMLIESLYGGYRIYSGDNKGDRTRLVREGDLVVGDVIIGRMSSSISIQIYVGGAFITLTSGIADDTLSLEARCERLMFYGRDFCILRPSYVK